MHTNKQKNNGMKGLSVRSQRCVSEMRNVVLVWFRFCFRAIFVMLHHFTFFSFQRSKKLLIAVNALLIRIYFAVWTQKHSLRTGFCFILNFKLEMELLRRKMRHDLDSKRIKCEMIFFSVSLFLFFLSTLNNNPEHNFTLIYTFPIAPLETRCCRSFSSFLFLVKFKFIPNIMIVSDFFYLFYL